MLLWIPLRQRPGIGTISNAIVIGLVIDATLTVLSQPGSLVARAGLLVVGWLLGGTVGIGTVLYALSIGPLAHFFIPRLTVGSLFPTDIRPAC